MQPSITGSHTTISAFLSSKQDESITFVSAAKKDVRKSKDEIGWIVQIRNRKTKCFQEINQNYTIKIDKVSILLFIY